MISLEVEGIKRVLNHPLFDMSKRRRKVEIFMEELAQIGVQSATIRFSEAEYDGDNDVVVKNPVWIDDNTLQITAEGASILFIEFGTGVYNPVQHPRARDLGMIRGEYGLGRGKNRAWVYLGTPGTSGVVIGQNKNGDDRILTKGNNANMCMYLASADMRDQIARVAERVFTK